MPNDKHFPPPVFEDGRQVRGVTIVLRSPDDLYRAWRELTDLPRFIVTLESVTRIDEHRSRWVAKAPVGQTVEWEAEITEDTPGRSIAWRSVKGSDVQTAGIILFTPLDHDRGTRVEVIVEYVAPFGAVGVAIGKVTGDDARTQVRRAMHRFRQVMETGEAAVRQGQPAGEGRDNRPDGDGQRNTDPDVRDVAGSQQRGLAQSDRS